MQQNLSYWMKNNGHKNLQGKQFWLSLHRNSVMNLLPRPDGGIGRRAGLKHQ
jgi:hypothetical protein